MQMKGFGLVAKERPREQERGNGHRLVKACNKDIDSQRSSAFSLWDLALLTHCKSICMRLRSIQRVSIREHKSHRVSGISFLHL